MTEESTKCMRRGTRSKEGTLSWNVPCLQVDGKAWNNKLRKWSSRHSRGHNLQRVVDKNEKIFGVVSKMLWHPNSEVGKGTFE